MNAQELEQLWAERRQEDEAIRRMNERARKFNKNPNYRGIGGDLEGDGAMIVAMGAMQAQAENKSQD